MHALSLHTHTQVCMPTINACRQRPSYSLLMRVTLAQAACQHSWLQSHTRACWHAVPTHRAHLLIICAGMICSCAHAGHLPSAWQIDGLECLPMAVHLATTPAWPEKHTHTHTTQTPPVCPRMPARTFGAGSRHVGAGSRHLCARDAIFRPQAIHTQQTTTMHTTHRQRHTQTCPADLPWRCIACLHSLRRAETQGQPALAANAILHTTGFIRTCTPASRRSACTMLARDHMQAAACTGQSGVCMCSQHTTMPAQLTKSLLSAQHPTPSLALPRGMRASSQRQQVQQAHNGDKDGAHEPAHAAAADVKQRHTRCDVIPQVFDVVITVIAAPAWRVIAPCTCCAVSVSMAALAAAAAVGACAATPSAPGRCEGRICLLCGCLAGALGSTEGSTKHCGIVRVQALQLYHRVCICVAACSRSVRM